MDDRLPPHIHDYYLVYAEHGDSTLRLLLQGGQYSEEHADIVAVWHGWLSFLGVADIDARPTEDDLNYGQRGGIADKVFQRLLGTREERKTAGTVRDLIREMADRKDERSTPLNLVDVLQTGYLLRTHTIGSYFIQARGCILQEH